MASNTDKQPENYYYVTLAMLIHTKVGEWRNLKLPAPMLRALVKKKKKAYIVYSQIDIMTGSAYINAINQENYMHELHISVFLFIFFIIYATYPRNGFLSNYYMYDSSFVFWYS